MSGPGAARLPLVIAAALLVLVSDGFDLAAVGYLAPELARAWGLGPAAFVPTFAAGVVGMLVGGPLLGWAGDRFGRRRLLLAGLLLIGAATLATAGVRTLTQLLALRVLTGIGLGGVIPNVVALVADAAPERVRGRLLVLVTLGMPLGGALPGLAAVLLVPRFGWPALMLTGGVLPLAVAGLVGLVVPATTSARGRDVSGGAGLFAGDLAVVTPMLWLCLMASQMAVFFALTWLPTLLQGAGGGTMAGATAALFSLGGLIGGVLLLIAMDRVGVAPVLLMFLLGAPLVAAMAWRELPPGVHAAVMVGAGACVTGAQVGLTALLGLFYPPVVRATGAGLAQAAGRLGALAAPLIGGVLLAWRVPLEQLPLAPAALMAAGASAAAVLAWTSVRRFGGWRPGMFVPVAAP